KFCQGPQITSPDPTATTTAAPTTTSTTTSTPKPSHTGYPEPAVIHPNLSLGGYYLNDEAYDVIISRAETYRNITDTGNRMLLSSVYRVMTLPTFNFSKTSCATSSVYRSRWAKRSSYSIYVEMAEATQS